MPDEITNLPLARTDSPTLYPCPTPDQVDSTLSEIAAHAPIKMPDPPDSVGRDVDEVAPPLERHADVEELEAVIVDAADSIAEALSVKASAALCGRTAEWVGERGFDELDTVSAETLVARQAALAVLMRATMFDARTGGMLTPANAEDAFRAAASEGESVAWCVLDDIAWLTDAAELEPVIAARRELTVSTAPSVDLGELYASVIPSDARQVLSQFRTPQWLGRAMRTWAAGDDDTVIDVGIGPAALSTPIHPTWQLHEEPREVIGVDRSPLAALLGETALTLTNQPHRMVVTDVRELTREKLPEKPDAAVCNPPYAAQFRIPEPDKTRWNEQVEQQTGCDISKLSSLYAYFMFHAETLLPDGGRAAFLTPESYLGTEYGTAVKRFLKERSDIKAFIRLDPDGTSVFPRADTTALLTLVEFDSHSDPTSDTRFVTVTDPEYSAVRAAMRSTGFGDRDWGTVNTVTQSTLDPDRNWQAQFDPVNVDTSHLVSLSNFATVRTIPPVGENDPFRLTYAEVAAYGISSQHLSRFVRRPQDVPGYVIREADDPATGENNGDGWMLDPGPSIEIPDTTDAFVEQYDAGTLTGSDVGGEHSGLFRYLYDCICDRDLRETEARPDERCWYRRTGHEPAPILVVNASQHKHRFLVNDAAVRTANSFYRLDLSVTGDARKAMLAYLNSGVMREISREYGYTRSGGMQKISLTKLKQLPVIDPSNVSEDIVQGLADAFDSLRETARHSDSHGQIIDTIDALVQRAIKQTRPD